MVRVLVNGCNGRMGQEVVKKVEATSEFEVCCGVDVENKNLYSFPVYSETSKIEQKPDVIIDFSIPKATLNIAKYAKENKIPLVVATTGLGEEDKETLKSYSKTIPIFQSANMSYDIFLMKKVVAEVAKALKDTDIEIIETHHNKKIDAPSGTALLLADSINEALDNTKTYDFDRLNKKEKRDKNEIGFSSIRGGNIVGEHKVCFFGENETFEITHKSYSRAVFAEGALKGASFILAKENGYYTMDDIT